MSTHIEVGHKFHHQSGDIRSVLFSDEESILLASEYGNRQTLGTADFIKQLEQNEYIQICEDKPHVVLKPYQKKARDERLVYMQELQRIVESEGLRPTTKAAYDKMIAAVELKKSSSIKHPARSTIARYWKAWAASSFDHDSLCSLRRTPLLVLIEHLRKPYQIMWSMRFIKVIPLLLVAIIMIMSLP
ncbi:hypothetical protein [Shewanella marina]|uniref:hypothetical protein n=1 Tax=Shewanella marina TaxID=487319 RepID=UPI00046E8A74|nr:hypothetical protein [Shewanella marina]